MAAGNFSNLTGIGLWGLDALAAAVGVRGSGAFGGDITAVAQCSIEAGLEAAKSVLVASSLTDAAGAPAAQTAELQARTLATESIRVRGAHAKAAFVDAAIYIFSRFGGTPTMVRPGQAPGASFGATWRPQGTGHAGLTGRSRTGRRMFESFGGPPSWGFYPRLPIP